MTHSEPFHREMNRRTRGNRHTVDFVIVACVVSSICGCATSALPSKTAVRPATYQPSPAPLSPAVLVGNTLYLSGNTGGDPVTGQLVTGGMEAEFRQIITNVQSVMHSAGLELTDVVSVTAYIADMDDYARFNELYRTYFKSDPLPARSTVAVKALARGARLELSMIAVRTR